MMLSLNSLSIRKRPFALFDLALPFAGLAPNHEAPHQAKPVLDQAAPIGPAHDLTKTVWLSIEGGPVRVTFDGTDPTTSRGHLCPDGWSVLVSPGMAGAGRFILAGETPASLQISQFK